MWVISGGDVMAKVVKAFSLDPEVARYIDQFENGTRSDNVNWALRSYFFSKYGEQIEALKESRAYWMNKCLSKGGVKHHLVELLRAIFRLGR
tara:strand:+ start:2325 stop:2600 length:276 start_codon:yes stop_codon:yes gene_type:complete